MEQTGQSTMTSEKQAFLKTIDNIAFYCKDGRIACILSNAYGQIKALPEFVEKRALVRRKDDRHVKSGYDRGRRSWSAGNRRSNKDCTKNGDRRIGPDGRRCNKDDRRKIIDV